jgi:hypothetical protein
MPEKTQEIVELATKRFRDAIKHMLATGERSHAFDVGTASTGEMYSALIILASRDEVDAALMAMGGLQPVTLKDRDS